MAERRLRLSGLPNNTALSLTASTGGESQQRSFTQPTITPPSEDYIATISDGSPVNLRRLTASVDAIGAGRRYASGYAPNNYVHRATATENHANKVVANAGTLNVGGLVRPPFWVNTAEDPGWATVYRISNGSMSIVRQSKITAYNSDVIRYHGWDNTEAKVSPYQFYFPTGNRAGVTYWFAVRGVHADGRVSPRSAWVSYAAPSAFASYANNQAARESGTELTVTAGAEDAALPVPTNVVITAGADAGTKFEVSCDVDPSLVGFVLETSDVDPATHTGEDSLELEAISHYPVANDNSPTSIQDGDTVFLSFELANPKRDFLTNRFANLSDGIIYMRPCRFSNGTFPDDYATLDYKLVPGHPDPAGGSHALEITIDAGHTGPTAELGENWHSGTGQNVRDVLAPGDEYVFEIWARITSGTGPANILFNPKLVNGNVTTSFTVTSAWQKFTSTPASYVTQYTGSNAIAWSLTFPAGHTFEVASPGLFQVGESRFRMSAQEITMGGSFEYIRDHSGASSLLNTMSARSRLNSPGDVYQDAGMTERHIVEECALMNSNGHQVSPWFQPNFHFLPEGHILKFDWFFGSAGMPGADLRIAQGRADPWADLFPKVAYEFGNETWNPIFNPWAWEFGGVDAVTAATYDKGEMAGFHSQLIFGILKSRPYYSTYASKIEFILGGNSTRSDFMPGYIARAPDATHVCVAAYSGGNEPGVTEKFLAQLNLADARKVINYTALPGFQNQQADTLIDTYATPNGLKAGSYEAGPGYLLNGLNGASVSGLEAADQNRIRKSVCQATAIIHSFLTLAMRGYDLQNYFLLREGNEWASHAAAGRGSGIYPAWQACQYYNENCTGQGYPVRVVRQTSATIPGSTDFEERPDAPDVVCFLTRDDAANRLSVIVLGMTVPFDQMDPGDAEYDPNDDGVRTVRFRLPIASATSLKKATFTNDILKHNWDNPGADANAEAIVMTETTETVPTASRGLVDFTASVEPGKVAFYVFDGVTNAN